MEHYKGLKGLSKAVNNLDNIVNSKKSKQQQNTLISNEFVKMNEPAVAADTWQLRKSIITNTEYKNAHMKAVTPYARQIYNGVRENGTKINYRVPTAKSKFFEYTWDKKKETLAEIYARNMQKQVNKL